jgi:hypothetical protein
MIAGHGLSRFGIDWEVWAEFQEGRGLARRCSTDGMGEHADPHDVDIQPVTGREILPSQNDRGFQFESQTHFFV